MTEADDHRVAELADAVRERPQVGVVAATSDLRDRGESRIPLQNRDRAVPASPVRERDLEGFAPAAVVSGEVRLLAGRLREIRDRLITLECAALVDAEVRGLASR